MTNISPPSVLLIGSLPPPYGGVSIHVSKLIEMLQARDINSMILAQNRADIFPSGTVTPKNFIHFLRLIKKYSKNALLVHDHTQFYQSFDLFLSSLYLWGMKRTHKKWLLTIHDGTFPSRIAEYGTVRRVLVARVLQHMAGIIVISNQLFDCVRSLGVEESKIRLIKSFLPISKNSEELPVEIAEFVHSHKPMLMTVGGFTETYHFDVVAQAFRIISKKFPQAGLVLISGSFTNDSSIHRTFYETIDSKRLLTLSDISHATVLALLRRSDVFVRSAFPDGDGLSLREALSVGTVVVATETGERPKSVKTYSALNAGHMAARILEALEVPRALPDDSVNKEAQQNFDRLLTLYREVSQGAVA